MHYAYLTKIILGILLYVALALFIGIRLMNWMRRVQRKLDRQIAFRMLMRKISGSRISRC